MPDKDAFGLPSGKPMGLSGGSKRKNLAVKVEEDGEARATEAASPKSPKVGLNRSMSSRGSSRKVTTNLDAKAYKQMVSRCMYNDPEEGYKYRPNKGPSHESLKFLIPKANSVAEPIKMWIPDTVVYGGSKSGQPFWLHSGAKGTIKCVKKFSQRHILEKFGNRRYIDDVVAVLKEPNWSQSSGRNVFRGNTLTLLSTRELKDFLAKNSDSPAVLQRFVKPKGKKAFMIRSCWKLGTPGCAWMVCNKCRFSDADVQPDAPKRFGTTLSTENSVTAFKLSGKAVEESEKKCTKIVAAMEAALGKRLDELVVDFLKDDSDQLWFLQVRAYKLVGEDVHGKGGESDEDEAPRRRRAKVPEAQNKCRFCCQVFNSKQDKEGLRYKMTTQMILDTTAHLKTRLSHKEFQKLLGGQSGGDLGMDASRLYHAHKVCKTCYELYQAEKDLQGFERKFARALGVPVPYTADDFESDDESETPNTLEEEVKDDASAFDSENEDEEYQVPRLSAAEKKAERKKLMQSKMLAQNKKVEGLPPIAGASNVPASLDSTVASTMPEEVTLCRLMIAIHSLYDLPKSLIDQMLDGRKGRFFTLRMTAFGNQYDVGIDFNNFHFRQPAASASASASGSPGSPTALAANRGSSYLPIQEFRVFHFFSGNTPVNGPLQDNSGLGQFLNAQPNLKVQLICNPKANSNGEFDDWYTLEDKMTNDGKLIIGEGQIPLLQFRSPFVKSVDSFVPLGLHLDMSQVKMSVGLERTREKVDPQTIISRGGDVKEHHGLYLPHDLFYTCDPLPEEWMSALQYSGVNRDSHAGSGLVSPYAGSPIRLKTLPEKKQGELSVETKPANPVQAVKQSLLKPKDSQDTEVYCVHVNVKKAHNLHSALDNSADDVPCWYTTYELFGETFRSPVASLQENGTLGVDYNRKHYVKASKQALVKYMEGQQSLMVNLVRSVSALEHQRVQTLRDIFHNAMQTETKSNVTVSALLDAMQTRSQRTQVVGTPEWESVLTDPISLGLQDHFKTYWSFGTCSENTSESVSELENTTETDRTLYEEEFLATGLLLLRLREVFLKACEGLNEICNATDVQRAVADQSDAIFFPTHLFAGKVNTNEDYPKNSSRQVVAARFLKQRDTFLRLVAEHTEANDKDTHLSWSEVLQTLERSLALANDLSSEEFPPVPVPRSAVIQQIHSGLWNLNNSRKTGISVTVDGSSSKNPNKQPRKLVRQDEKDRTLYVCDVPLDPLEKGGDSVDGSFDVMSKVLEADSNLASETAGKQVLTELFEIERRRPSEKTKVGDLLYAIGRKLESDGPAKNNGIVVKFLNSLDSDEDDETNASTLEEYHHLFCEFLTASRQGKQPKRFECPPYLHVSIWLYKTSQDGASFNNHAPTSPLSPERKQLHYLSKQGKVVVEEDIFFR